MSNALFQTAFPLPPLPASSARTYAKWPVWKDSVRIVPKCVPIPRLRLTKMWHQLCRRLTRLGGRAYGVLGGTLRAVYYTLAFDFLNHRTGRCNPCYESIAAKTGIARSTVARALAVLRRLGFINWVRTCEPDDRNGGFILVQTANEYALLPPSHWRGPSEHCEPTPPPAPAPGTSGEHPTGQRTNDVVINRDRQAPGAGGDRGGRVTIDPYLTLEELARTLP